MKKVTMILCLACVVALCCSCATKTVNVVKPQPAGNVSIVEPQEEGTQEAALHDVQKTEPEEKRQAIKMVCNLSLRMAWILFDIALAVL